MSWKQSGITCADPCSPHRWKWANMLGSTTSSISLTETSTSWSKCERYERYTKAAQYLAKVDEEGNEFLCRSVDSNDLACLHELTQASNSARSLCSLVQKRGEPLNIYITTEQSH